MSAEHGQISYRDVATLDSGHPAYKSTDKTAPLVISIPSDDACRVIVQKGRFPYDHCYRLTGTAKRVTIVGGDQRRGFASIIKVDSPEIGYVSAFSDVTILTSADSSTITNPQTDARILSK